MNFNSLIFKTTEMHWQQRQVVIVRFENKRIEDTTKSQAKESTA